MFKYVGKNAVTGEIAIKIFHSTQEANLHRLKMMNEYPESRIILIQELSEKERAAKKMADHAPLKT